MRILGIETATACQSVAVLDDTRVLAEAASPAQGTRGGLLLPMLDTVLNKAGLRPDALDAVAVSVGPGSFTGVRVGLATAKGLTLATHARLVGVSTLEVLAAGYPLTEGLVCALLDAGRGEVYAGIFRRQKDSAKRLQAYAVLIPEALGPWFRGVADEDIHLIGDGAARYGERLAAACGARGRLDEAGLHSVPSAVNVAKLGARQLDTRSLGESGEVLPVYLRRAEAEVNWEKGLVQSPLERLAKTKRSGARGAG